MHSWPKVLWNSSSTASVQLHMVSIAEIKKICFLKSRIDHCYIYTNSNGIAIMFHAIITQGVLEQLVNTFSAAADGICRRIMNLLFLDRIAYSASKTEDFHYFSADTICSCTEAVGGLFQDTSGYDCIEHDFNTIAVCVCMTIVYCILKKKRFS